MGNDDVGWELLGGQSGRHCKLTSKPASAKEEEEEAEEEERCSSNKPTIGMGDGCGWVTRVECLVGWFGWSQIKLTKQASEAVVSCTNTPNHRHIPNPNSSATTQMLLLLLLLLFFA